MKSNLVVSSPVLGMIAFIFIETMFFSAFISAYLIVRSGVLNWPPMGQPRLPVLTTGFNTLVLLASGLLLYKSYRLFSKEGFQAEVGKIYLSSLILGIVFFLLQGYEWARLISFGLTMTSSVYGSFFYLIIGFHALHLLAALVVMAIFYKKLEKRGVFSAVLTLWLFVVGVWPALYGLVYLR